MTSSYLAPNVSSAAKDVEHCPAQFSAQVFSPQKKNFFEAFFPKQLFPFSDPAHFLFSYSVLTPRGIRVPI